MALSRQIGGGGYVFVAGGLWEAWGMFERPLGVVLLLVASTVSWCWTYKWFAALRKRAIQHVLRNPRRYELSAAGMLTAVLGVSLLLTGTAWGECILFDETTKRQRLAELWTAHRELATLGRRTGEFRTEIQEYACNEGGAPNDFTGRLEEMMWRAEEITGRIYKMAGQVDRRNAFIEFPTLLDESCIRPTEADNIAAHRRKRSDARYWWGELDVIEAHTIGWGEEMGYDMEQIVCNRCLRSEGCVAPPQEQGQTLEQLVEELRWR